MRGPDMAEPGVTGGPTCGRLKRRVGVIGTFVWDVIHAHPPTDAPTEGWGGVTYALGALDAALAPDWEVVPLIKVGADVAAEAREFLGELRHLAPDAELVEVPGVNNRSELRYMSAERRTERLSGHTPGWSWAELGPRVAAAGLDALYVNFLSGWELDLPTARSLRQSLACPIYADLHMLVWAPHGAGERRVGPLAAAAEWYRCFDLLQVNEEELVALAPDAPTLAEHAARAGMRCAVVTLGSAGVHAFPVADFDGLGGSGRSVGRAPAAVPPSPIVAPSAQVPLAGVNDPTGCGDVWGATFFARLLAGEQWADALHAASVAAARNVAYRGATGLAAHLARG